MYDIEFSSKFFEEKLSTNDILLPCVKLEKPIANELRRRIIMEKDCTIRDIVFLLKNP